MPLVARPVWPVKPNWDNPLTEGKEWLTSILASASGAEQRRAMRYWPRRDFEFDIAVWDSDRFWLENFIHHTSAVEYYLPVFKDGARASFNSVHPRRVYVKDAESAGYVAGGVLVILGEQLRDHEYLEVASVAADYVTVSTDVVGSYTPKAKAYPALVAKLVEQPKFSRKTDTVQTTSVKFIETKGRSIPTPVATSVGPMVLDGLIVNSYHLEEGRGGYFHANSGTSEGQFVFIYALYRVYEELINGTAEEMRAARYYRDLAETMLDAMGPGDFEGPMLRQPIPSNPDVITLLHWLFAARGDIPMQNIVYTLEATRTADNKLVIPNNWRGSEVYNVWTIYPATSKLLYESPYSPAYDITTPTSATQTTINPGGFTREQFRATVNIPGNNDLGASNAGINNFKIVFGYNNAALIPHRAAQEAYPNWTLIDPGYSACAPDTFRWSEQALTEAIQHETRAGYPTKWNNLRLAMRRTAVKGQNLSDLREVIQPLVGFDPIPASGAPDGMFCYSDHPLAIPPVKPGLDKGWTGYDFWTRAANGDIVGDIPAGAKSQVQIGRGFADQWRTSQTYQDPDQYLYIAMSTSKSPLSGEDVLVYMSQTQAYDPNTRWFARLQSLSNWAHVSGASDVVEYFIPISAFFSRLFDSSGAPYDGAGFAAGQTFENFGLSIEMAGPYRVRLRTLRLVSGVSAAWVLANKTKAVKGSQMPYFPGAMPFAINADTKRQQFVGWNGSPFHGYQLPDFWWWLAADADAVHPNLTVTDLPVAAANGSLIYPISATNPNGSTKPKAALLAEQQLMFLQAAAAKWVADGGAAGPWAHTFVLNTPARKSLGNPTPHTWVYVNDDPNTRWLGYQVRVVESLTLLGFLSKNTANWQRANTLALDMAQNWLQWLSSTWTSTTTGIPTDFINPAIGGPQTLYEEPHAAAILLRGCLWLRMCRTGLSWLDPLMVKLFNYIESKWVTTGDMKYTWSADPVNHIWYGFWHGEIMQAYADLLGHSASVPSGISLTTMRSRLVQTQEWMALHGVKNTNAAPLGSTGYRGYAVLTKAPNEKDALDREFARIMAEYDPGLGLSAFKETGDRLFEMQTYTWFLHGREQQKEMADFLDAVKGRWLPFWVPSFMSDFVLAENAARGSTEIVVHDVGFTTYGGPVEGRKDVFIQYRDGTFDCRRLRNSVLGGERTEVLTLDEGVSKTLRPSTVKRISLMQLKRFNQDRVDISHHTDSHGMATCSAILRSAPELRQALPAFYRVGE